MLRTSISSSRKNSFIAISFLVSNDTDTHTHTHACTHMHAHMHARTCTTEFINPWPFIFFFKTFRRSFMLLPFFGYMPQNCCPLHFVALAKSLMRTELGMLLIPDCHYCYFQSFLVTPLILGVMTYMLFMLDVSSKISCIMDSSTTEILLKRLTLKLCGFLFCYQCFCSSVAVYNSLQRLCEDNQLSI